MTLNDKTAGIRINIFREGMNFKDSLPSFYTGKETEEQRTVVTCPRLHT